MPTIRIVIEIEAGEAGQTSVRIEQPKRAAELTRKEGAIEARVRRFIDNLGDNERTVLKAVLQASVQDKKIYRKQLMPELGFDDLLQFNGVLAWITRKYRKWIGEPESWLVETIYDESKEDYSLEIQPEVYQEVMEELMKRVMGQVAQKIIEESEAGKNNT